MIDGHGDDLYRYGGRIRHNFSSNICQDADNSSLKTWLVSRLDAIDNYPEPAPVSVERLLADSLTTSADCVMVTNGAADAIHAIARTFGPVTSAVLQPTFAEYADATRIYGHTVISFNDLEKIPADAGIVWICNPNNPTGHTYSPLSLIAAVDSNPDKLFVIDQAYRLYTETSAVTAKAACSRDNMILLRSLTKDYAIPGLRIGYAIGSPSLTARLKACRVPWSVNALAIEAAHFLLKGNSRPVFDRSYLLAEARRVASSLTQIGIDVTPSATNYMLCRLPRGTAAELKAFMVQTEGILIRDASNFEGLTPSHFRIAVQETAANNLLIETIKRWMQS